MTRFGKSVVLVLNGKELDALVVREHSHPPIDGSTGRPLLLQGKPAPVVEYLDLAYVDPGLEGLVKTNAVDAIVRPAYDVAPFVEGARIGWKAAQLIKEEDLSDQEESAEQSALQVTATEIANLRKQMEDMQAPPVATTASDEPVAPQVPAEVPAPAIAASAAEAGVELFDKTPEPAGTFVPDGVADLGIGNADAGAQQAPE